MMTLYQTAKLKFTNYLGSNHQISFPPIFPTEKSYPLYPLNVIVKTPMPGLNYIENVLNCPWNAGCM